jgi:hypothetical protein
MAQYKVYLSGDPRVIEASSQDSLRSLREKLGSQANDYNFVYLNNFTGNKTILNDRAVEARQTLQNITFSDNMIIMTLIQGSKTDLFGMRTDWLSDRHIGVKIGLNQSDPNAVRQNDGKFQPIMLTDVQPSNPGSNAFYSRAVICEKGSIVRFDVSSWGAAGFGYSIASDKDTICDGLYICYGDTPNHKATASLLRYQSSKNTIQIESTQVLGIPTSDIIHYQKVTVKSWRLTKYSQNGRTYSSDMQAPVIAAPGQAMARILAGNLETRLLEDSDRGGFDPGPVGGDTFVPGQSIETGAPSRGPESQQNFGSMYDIREDDRHTTVLGAVVFYFFVFKDRASANKVINVLNSPTPGAIG